MLNLDLNIKIAKNIALSGVFDFSDWFILGYALIFAAF